MKIKRLTLSNFRGFKSLDVDFDENLTVLVGLNGQGKSTVLDAIAIGFGQFLSPLQYGKDEFITNSDVHLAKVDADSKGERKQNVPQLPAYVAIETFKSEDPAQPQHWQRSLSDLKAPCSKVLPLFDFAKQLQQKVYDDKDVELPLLAYYRVVRNQLKPVVKESEPANRIEGYLECLDARSSFTSFNHWLRKETFIAFQLKMEQQGNDELSLTQQRLDQLEEVLNEVLKPSGWRNVRYSAAYDDICAEHDDYGQVPVDVLSDGVLNIIGIIGDIACRAIQLNTKVYDKPLADTNGIVLIDEIDLHLHPQWQQVVLQSLTKAFPNIQFIVTTHSPQVLSTVHNRNIGILNNESGVGKCIKPLGDTYMGWPVMMY